MNLTIKSSMTSIADLFFPRVCVVCGCTLGLKEKYICLECLCELPQTHFETMAHNQMSIKLNESLSSLRPDESAAFSYAFSLFYYNGYSYKTKRDYSNITKDLKYRANIPAGKYFSRLLAQKLSLSPLYQDVEVVVPVPLHWTRRLERGYNQSEIIAKAVADNLSSKPKLEKLLIRTKHTKTQTHLNGDEKKANVRGVFQAKASNSKHILIIDDVFTSGATLSHCVLALRDQCPKHTRISVATLGFVGEL